MRQSGLRPDFSIAAASARANLGQVDTFDDIEEAYRVTGLVALQRADQMQLDIGIIHS